MQRVRSLRETVTLVSLETVLDPANLRRIWRGARKAEREIRLTKAPLVRDSTGGVAFDLELKRSLEGLRSSVLSGSYRPRPPFVVEATKTTLLRRRMFYLVTEDDLLLHALVNALRPSLLARMPKWVNFGWGDSPEDGGKSKDQAEGGYDDWWTRWLKFMGALKVVSEDARDFVVISDVTDFFGSIELPLLRTRVDAVANVDNRSIDLLFDLLNRVRPAEKYGMRALVGLPVVRGDASRILAHFFLLELDDELTTEGKQNRYTRWVDDMVVSASDETDGARLMSRIEQGLWRLGLLPNSSKTSLISKSEFRAQHHVDENDFLDLVEELTDDSGLLSAALRTEFELRLLKFVRSERKGYWSRVLRRYYSASRRIRSKTLLRYWDEHLGRFPDQAPHILDYTSSFPGTLQLAQRTFRFIRQNQPLNDDLQILIYEMLMMVSFPNDYIIRAYIARRTLYHSQGTQGFLKPSLAYLVGLQMLVSFKFGQKKSVQPMLKGLRSSTVSADFALHALPVVAACDALRDSVLVAIENIVDPRIIRLRTLIRRLEAGDNEAIGRLIGFLNPKRTKFPVRAIVNSRVLPLIYIADRAPASPSKQRMMSATKNVVSLVRSTGLPEDVDYVTRSHM